MSLNCIKPEDQSSLKHYGIICPAAAGHLNPACTLGAELQSRGHQVTVIGVRDAESKAQAAGLNFQVIAEDEYPEGTTKRMFDILGALHGIEAFRFTLKEIVEKSTRINLQYVPDAVRKCGVNVLLVDQVQLEGIAIAEHLRIPYITTCNAITICEEPDIPPFIATWAYNTSILARLRNELTYRLIRRLTKSIRDAVNEYRKRWNQKLIRKINDSDSKLAIICQQVPEMDFPRKCLPTCFHYCGPYSNPATREVSEFPWKKLSGQKMIYASMGTIQNRYIWIFKMIAEACADMDVQLVIALGGGEPPEVLQDMPENTIVAGYAPQLELIKKASLVVTHAGMNTTMESLGEGVPMIAIPITNDQPGVAARIAWSGSGILVPINKVNVKRIQTAIEQVLTQDAYNQNAQRIKKAIGKAGGVSHAADVVEQASLQSFLGNPTNSIEPTMYTQEAYKI
eukprot:TRINITY_DN3765_c0_g1_i1.p1 TRINITY_DN3765_c0_g1~~TRINITY_DN3765_c0_g1_i1.p1  ORF type:complete len:499 (-),score=39.94 TRINITY_DN3765_c0_g1_i1:254-1615(-)